MNMRNVQSVFLIDLRSNMAEFKNFGFYTIDTAYLEFLNSKDSEVYYNASYRNVLKPFVGIIIDIAEYKYFIPLTSAKEKHKKWKNICDEHFLIYEIVDEEIQISGDVYKVIQKVGRYIFYQYWI